MRRNSVDWITNRKCLTRLRGRRAVQSAELHSQSSSTGSSTSSTAPATPVLGPGSRPRARRSPGMAASYWMLTGEESPLSVLLWRPKSRKQLCLLPESGREALRGLATSAGLRPPSPNPSSSPCPGSALPGAALQLGPARNFVGVLPSVNFNA